jgi:hypothetical protein
MDQLLREKLTQRLIDRKKSDKKLIYSIGVYVMMSVFTLGYFSVSLLEDRSLVHYTLSQLPFSLTFGTFLLSIVMCLIISENYLARVNEIDTLQNVMVVSTVALTGVLMAVYTATTDIIGSPSFDVTTGYAMLSLSFISFQVFVGVMIYIYAVYEAYQYKVHSKSLMTLMLKTIYTVFMLALWFFEILFFDFIF